MTEIREDIVLIEAQDRAIKHWKSANHFARRSIEEAWKCGRALAEVRDLVDHGGWRRWLASVSISKSTAHRWIQLSERYELSHIGTFGSVHEALKALPARAKPDTSPRAGKTLAVEAPDGCWESAALAASVADGESEATPDARCTGTGARAEDPRQEIQQLRMRLNEAREQIEELRLENAGLRLRLQNEDT